VSGKVHTVTTSQGNRQIELGLTYEQMPNSKLQPNEDEIVE